MKRARLTASHCRTLAAGHACGPSPAAQGPSSVAEVARQDASGETAAVPVRVPVPGARSEGEEAEEVAELHAPRHCSPARTFCPFQMGLRRLKSRERLTGESQIRVGPAALARLCHRRSLWSIDNGRNER